MEQVAIIHKVLWGEAWLFAGRVKQSGKGALEALGTNDDQSIAHRDVMLRGRNDRFIPTTDDCDDPIRAASDIGDRASHGTRPFADRHAIDVDLPFGQRGQTVDR